MVEHESLGRHERHRQDAGNATAGKLPDGHAESIDWGTCWTTSQHDCVGAVGHGH